MSIPTKRQEQKYGPAPIDYHGEIVPSWIMGRSVNEQFVKERLMDRLTDLIDTFQADVESLGFTF